MSLRARLLGTYLLLLAITLGVMAVTLVLILRARPAPPAQTYQRLAAVAQSINLRDVLSGNMWGNFGSRETLLQALTVELNEVATDYNVRLLIVNIPDQTTIYDSGGRLRAGEHLALTEANYTLPPAIRRGIPARLESIFGSFEEQNGAEWLFVGLMTVNQGNALLFADPAETVSLQTALSDFASALALPLCQAALVGLVVAVALAYFSSRTVLKSLQQLVDASRSVAEGNYYERIPVTGAPEVRAVSEAFNHMTEQVRGSQQAQHDFLANVSHDLKTPLTSIQGFSQAIIDGAARDPVVAARIIHEEAGRLNRMVVQLTDLARLQAGRFSMQLTPLDMGQIAKAVSERLEIVAQEKGVNLRVKTMPMPEVAGDGDRMAQVLTNLVSNAINYTPKGGSVFVETRIDHFGVEVVVRDTGVGIPPEELPRIFERFYQVDKARGPKRGTGLGLAIVQEIVQAHGGRITVASDGKGKGSTFTIWLPSPQLSTIVQRRK